MYDGIISNENRSPLLLCLIRHIVIVILTKGYYFNYPYIFFLLHDSIQNYEHLHQNC